MDIQFPQILFQAINFLIVMGSLSYLMYKPILKIFEERSQRIAEGQKAAQTAITQREKIDELEKETQIKLDQKATKAMEKAAQDASAEKALILAEAREQAEREIENLRQKWLDEKSQMLKNMNDQLVEAVLQTSSKVIGSSLTASKHSQLINSELNTILKQI